jgi:hypothetical protein
MICKIHNVIEGPFEDDEDNIWVVCLAELGDDEELEHIEVFLDDFDSGYNMVRHFSSSIEPIVFEVPDDYVDMRS